MDFNVVVEKFLKDNQITFERRDQDMICYYINHPGHIPAILDFVKKSDDLRFTILVDLFAVDYPADTKRFEVVYHLLSLQLNKRFCLKTRVAEDEPLESVDKIFSSACWYEREAFDMFGIEFSNSHDLRRILTDYGFKGHPLRKDFPLTGRVQVKYDEKLEKVVYEPVVLEQEFRNFDFSSPWYGPDQNCLPGDEKAKIVDKEK